MYENITENPRKHEDEWPLHKQLELLGKMAAEIGHELRNPLTTVRGYLQIFRSKELFAEYRTQLDMMIAELDQANEVIIEFLYLAKNKRVEQKLGI
ncbi:MAG: kinE 1 [Firmicutes bacterium]|nr:kinE 1 [Bacillota bacterium]